MRLLGPPGRASLATTTDPRPFSFQAEFFAPMTINTTTLGHARLQNRTMAVTLNSNGFAQLRFSSFLDVTNDVSKSNLI